MIVFVGAVPVRHVDGAMVEGIQPTGDKVSALLFGSRC